MARVRSKSDVIRSYYENFSAGPFISRKQLGGIILAVICGLTGIGLVIAKGGFAAAGLPCAIAFGAAFVLAVYSATKLFSALVDHRDAKRFIQARVIERADKITEAALSILPEEKAKDCAVVTIGGYSPDSIDDDGAVFYVEDTGKAHSNHYEKSAIFVADGTLHWLRWIYRLDTPEPKKMESHGSLPCDAIIAVAKHVRTFSYETPRKTYELSYPYLKLATVEGDGLLFSLAHFDPFDDTFDSDQENEVREIYESITRSRMHSEVNTGEPCHFLWK